MMAVGTEPIWGGGLAATHFHDRRSGRARRRRHVARSNVYNQVVPFVPFTKLEGEAEGTHNGNRRN